jgi:hypothetical protein
MAISYVGAASDNGDTVTLPTHQAGDLIVLFVYRTTSSTAPTPVTGWLLKTSDSSGANALLVAFKIANSNSETAGTWTNATQIGAAVYRSDKILQLCRFSVFGATVGSGGNVTYSAISPGTDVSDKWHIAVVGHRAIDTDIEVAPGAMTNRTNVVGASAGELAIHDTNGNSASWSATSYTLTSGTSTNVRTAVLELVESVYPVSSGGGFRAVNIRGGADQ